MVVKKDKSICVRVDPTEKMVIKKVAEKRKMSVSKTIVSVMKEEYLRLMHQNS